jgi:hypothetical protein
MNCYKKEDNEVQNEYSNFSSGSVAASINGVENIPLVQRSF